MASQFQNRIWCQKCTVDYYIQRSESCQFRFCGAAHLSMAYGIINMIKDRNDFFSEWAVYFCQNELQLNFRQQHTCIRRSVFTIMLSTEQFSIEYHFNVFGIEPVSSASRSGRLTIKLTGNDGHFSCVCLH